MNTLLTSLPGDIPGLLRRGSPVQSRRGGEGVVQRSTCGLVGHALVSGGARIAPQRVANLTLDLTDLTGRWHAAIWCAHQPEAVFEVAIAALPGGLFVARAAYDAAFAGDDMTPTQIDTLARLVLRLAGRAA